MPAVRPKVLIAALAAIALLSCTAGDAPAQDAAIPVELVLVLAIDTSASVDLEEFELQYRGLANAFRDPGVIGAIEQVGGNGIAVMVMQWAGPYSHYIAVPWYHVRTTQDSHGLAVAIDSAYRAFLIDVTAIGAAIDKAVEYVSESPFEGRRRVIDVSGDGKSNFGGEPGPARDRAVSSGVTVNGLVIVGDNPDLVDHYRNEVIGGYAAFLIEADDFRDYAVAIRQKLIREIAGPPVSQRDPGDDMLIVPASAIAQ